MAKLSSAPFTLRSEIDLLATFRDKDQQTVVLPKFADYPAFVRHYFAWSEPSGVYTYLVYKRADWETPIGLTFQRNGSGSRTSPAGMCEWCHHSGPSDEVGLMTVVMTPRSTGGTWLCLDLDCLNKLEALTAVNGKSFDKAVQKLGERIGEFYQRAVLDRTPKRKSDPAQDL
jgi:hypothetical protein